MVDDFGKRHWAMMIAMSLLAIALMLGAGFLLAWLADKVAVGDAKAASAACRVSPVIRSPVPGRTGFNYGSARIAVALPSDGTFAAIRDGSPGGANAFLQKDGWIRTKIGWYAKRGVPRVTGQRLGGAGRVRADVGQQSWVNSGMFYPSLLYFPSFGCWRITATAGGARLDAVVRVVRR